ncbi:DUF4241 domain-containing protein [Pendulispora brunnea]|uniref:DUF4241 domain-containing protein n=1 Tax=Pendulispora brunnea TaxID=2905690 RepID=A0ABZ2K6L6_9BACT
MKTKKRFEVQASAIIEKLLSKELLLMKKGRDSSRLMRDLARLLEAPPLVWFNEEPEPEEVMGRQLAEYISTSQLVDGEPPTLVYYQPTPGEVSGRQLAEFLTVHEQVDELFAEDDDLESILRETPAAPEFRGHPWHAPEWTQWLATALAGAPPDWQGAVEVLEAGEVSLPTGRLVACDPCWAHIRGKHFVRAVKPGTYPLSLVVCHFEHSLKVRNALSVIRLSGRDPRSWELALCDDQKLDELRRGEIYGFPVDAGIGCYVDAAHVSLLESKDEKITEAMLQASPSVGRATIDFAGGLLTVFVTGAGDGCYPTFFGLDEDGDPACVVSIFGILPSPWPHVEDHEDEWQPSSG